MAVYSRRRIVNGALVAALINKNKEEFDASVSSAIVGKSMAILVRA